MLVLVLVPPRMAVSCQPSFPSTPYVTVPASPREPGVIVGLRIWLRPRCVSCPYFTLPFYPDIADKFHQVEQIGLFV